LVEKMRYFGKEGAQCHLPDLSASTRTGSCRKLARAVLFGRVPPHLVRCLGIVVVVGLLALAISSFGWLNRTPTPQTRDMGSAVMIRR